jgi:general L-amino acid transport system permease protein
MRLASSWVPRLIQALVLLAVAAAVAWLVDNTLSNMQARGIQGGFDFVLEPAGFDIGEALIDYGPEAPFWRAFVVGLLNTLRVALPAMAMATALGLLVAVGRISAHPITRALGTVYTEILRNIPLMIQLLTWYVLLIEWMPDAAEPWVIGTVAQWSKSGLTLFFGEDATLYLSPEYLALCLGLTLYTSAFIAEVFRGGIESVPRAQSLAAQSLGMTPAQTLRHVVIPQALKVSVPPLSSQYLNLSKNSSLAVAIGYPDLVSIANTALNQTGRAVECIAITMAIYLGLSLLTAWVMNRYNQKVMRHG